MIKCKMWNLRQHQRAPSATVSKTDARSNIKYIKRRQVHTDNTRETPRQFRMANVREWMRSKRSDWKLALISHSNVWHFVLLLYKSRSNTKLTKIRWKFVRTIRSRLTFEWTKYTRKKKLCSHLTVFLFLQFYCHFHYHVSSYRFRFDFAANAKITKAAWLCSRRENPSIELCRYRGGASWMKYESKAIVRRQKHK